MLLEKKIKRTKSNSMSEGAQMMGRKEEAVKIEKEISLTTLSTLRLHCSRLYTSSLARIH